MKNLYKRESRIKFYAIYLLVGIFVVALLNLAIVVFNAKTDYYIDNSIPILIYLIIALIFVIFEFIIWLFGAIYYQSDRFNAAKKLAYTNVQKTNEFNEYLDELKIELFRLISGRKEVKGKINKNLGSIKYKRKNKQFADNIYNCSLSVYNNASNNPLKYICKYFNIKIDMETVHNLEVYLEKVHSVNEGLENLFSKREDIIKSIKLYVPSILLKFDSNTFYKKLGFSDFNFSDDYLTRFIFRYTSPAGRSSQEYVFVCDQYNVELLMIYVLDIINKKRAVKYQRQLLTSSLREEIKKRDNYTCQLCGISIFDEPHLLLEIDHIIPCQRVD